MPDAVQPRRVLIVAPARDLADWHTLFAAGPLFGWEAQGALDIVQARFLMQHDPCAVVLVEECVLRTEGPDALDLLGGQIPIVLLAGAAPDLVPLALQHGVDSWLPRDLALRYPSLLTATLDQVHKAGLLRQGFREASESLRLCRRQVTRLVELLWESSPAALPTPWLTQRSMLMRLEEEVARADRQGAPFSIALGEIQADVRQEDARVPEEEVATWIAEHLRRIKRRADVAGRYGPRGFMLLMVETAEAAAAMGCRRLQHSLEEEARRSTLNTPHLRVCFGTASYSLQVRSPKILLSCAERRLQAAIATSRGNAAARV